MKNSSCIRPQNFLYILCDYVFVWLKIMAENTAVAQTELLKMAAKMTSSYIEANHLPLSEVKSVLATFYSALTDLQKSTGSVRSWQPSEPAVPIDESVHDDYIICLEDGKRLQMLKRHLSTVYRMTPEEYRERWGLPADYPMVAPGYAQRRSAIAINSGLGRGRRVKIVDGRSGSAAVA